MSQTAVDRAQRPVERFGEGDVAGIVGGDVCAQFEGRRISANVGSLASGMSRRSSMACSNRSSVMVPASQRRRRTAVVSTSTSQGGEFSVLTEQFTGLPVGLLVVADGDGQHGGVDDDHLLERSSARSACRLIEADPAAARSVDAPENVDQGWRDGQTGQFGRTLTGAMRWCGPSRDVHLARSMPSQQSLSPVTNGPVTRLCAYVPWVGSPRLPG